MNCQKKQKNKKTNQFGVKSTAKRYCIIHKKRKKKKEILEKVLKFLEQTLCAASNIYKKTKKQTYLTLIEDGGNS